MLPDEYRKLAETEDRMWYFQALHRRLAQGLARLLPPGSVAAEPVSDSRRPRVLDAGCGTGGFLKSDTVKAAGWRMTGVDVSPLACQLARERSGAEVHEGSITALPFAPESFDAVVTGDVLYHVADVAQALREFARCVKPGGAVLANEPAYRWLWSYHDVATEAKHRFSRPELTGLFRAAGLDVVFASYVNSWALPLVAARRKLFPAAVSGSDVQLSAPPVEATFAGLARLEAAWLRHAGPLPAGTSVFVAGIKR